VQEKLTAQQAYLVQLAATSRLICSPCSSKLVSVQELTGQSQQRLTELRGRLEEQARQPVPVLDTSRGGVGGAGRPVRESGGPGGRSRCTTSRISHTGEPIWNARQAFREFLRVFPTTSGRPTPYFIGSRLRAR